MCFPFKCWSFFGVTLMNFSWSEWFRFSEMLCNESLSGHNHFGKGFNFIVLSQSRVNFWPFFIWLPWECSFADLHEALNSSTCCNNFYNFMTESTHKFPSSLLLCVNPSHWIKLNAVNIRHSSYVAYGGESYEKYANSEVVMRNCSSVQLSHKLFISKETHLLAVTVLPS